jgi:CHAT domain-containing protein
MKKLAWALACVLFVLPAHANEEEILALVRSAEAALDAGRNPQALAQLERASALTRESGAQALVPAIEASLGHAYLASGRFADAERTLRSAVQSARAQEKPAVAAAALNNLGNLLAAGGQHGAAAETYREALVAARSARAGAAAARASANLARALIDDGRNAEAAALLADLGAQARALEPSRDKAHVLISIGRLYSRLGSRNAHAFLQDALGVAEAIGDSRARSYALGYLGELYEQAGKTDDALQLAQRATFAAQEAQAPDIAYRWQWQAGRLLRAQGRTEQAILSYQHAVAALTTARVDLVAGATRASFRESIGPVYAELAELLIDQSTASGDVKRSTQYLLDARNTMELLKGAELQDYFQDDCVAELRARTAGIDQVGTRTAALYPIILKDRVELLLTLPDGLQRFTARVDAATFTREIRAFRTRLERRTTHQYYPHARQLYDWLIGPIAAVLESQKVDTLVIVPDGALRTIPLAALHDGERFLVERYAIATTPGLTLTDPRPIARERAQVLLNGLTESVQGFAPLPHVAEELAAIHEIYGGTLLQDRAFTIPNMEKGLEATPYSIVHIASHAQFDRQVDRTFLLTYENKLSMDKLEQFLGLSKFRTEAVELLTLSACETAAGDDRAALGLAGLAIKAGARSALATLWIVNDPAAAAMVSQFYREFQDPALSKAKALQRAQLTLLKDVRYRHPNYWSAFLLIGNWL